MKANSNDVGDSASGWDRRQKADMTSRDHLTCRSQLNQGEAATTTVMDNFLEDANKTYRRRIMTSPDVGRSSCSVVVYRMSQIKYYNDTIVDPSGDAMAADEEWAAAADANATQDDDEDPADAVSPTSLKEDIIPYVNPLQESIVCFARKYNLHVLLDASMHVVFVSH